MYICSPTYKRFDLLVKMITSSENGSTQPDGYVILDNSAGELIPYLEKNAPNILELPNIEILIAQYNMGVARGWNALMKYVMQTYGEDAFCLIVNDDIEFEHNTVELFTDLINYPTNYDMIAYPKEAFYARYPIICGATDNVNAFSMFVCNPKILYDTVGWFDSTIFPAYFDDNDLHWRMKLKGLELYRVEQAHAKHLEGGSATLKSYSKEDEERHHHQFRRNQEYFIRKWGGLPGNEKYLQPFDSQDIMQHMIEIRQKYGF